MTGAAPVPVLGDGPQPVVEGATPQGRTLAHYPEAESVVPRDNGVEPAQPLKVHLRPQPVGPGDRDAAKRYTVATASIRRMSKVSHSLDIG